MDNARSRRFSPPSTIDFYDFEEYEALGRAAAALDTRAHLIILLGGDAGFRSGEMRALAWTDINFGKRQLCVERNDWRGHVSTTKGGRLRYVPLTKRLAETLREHRHLRGPLVLYRDDGRSLTEYVLQEFVARVARRANFRSTEPHMLRHTFVHAWQCAARRLGRFKSWPGIANCRRRSGTCTSVRVRLTVQFDSWNSLFPYQLLETSLNDGGDVKTHRSCVGRRSPAASLLSSPSVCPYTPAWLQAQLCSLDRPIERRPFTRTSFPGGASNVSSLCLNPDIHPCIEPRPCLRAIVRARLD